MTNTISSISQENKLSLAGALKSVMADSFALYFKTHSFHWNVEGPHFHGLHGLFEEQYNEIWTALDEIAERIRTLGEYAPMSYSDLTDSAGIGEEKSIPEAMDMVKTLAADNLAVVQTLQAALEIAQEAGDEATADLIIGRITTHEKAAWMLNSTAK